MKVSEAIKYLSEMNQEEEIIIAWWAQEDSDFNDDQWEKIIAKEGKIDWSHDAEMMNDIAEMD